MAQTPTFDMQIFACFIYTSNQVAKTVMFYVFRNSKGRIRYFFQVWDPQKIRPDCAYEELQLSL